MCRDLYAQHVTMPEPVLSNWTDTQNECYTNTVQWTLTFLKLTFLEDAVESLKKQKQIFYFPHTGSSHYSFILLINIRASKDAICNVKESVMLHKQMQIQCRSDSLHHDQHWLLNQKPEI